MSKNHIVALVCGLFGALLCAGAHAQDHAASVHIDSLSAATPAHLSLGEELTVKVRYEAAEPGKVQILARPWKGGKPVADFSAEESPFQKAAKGEAACSFSFKNPAEIDEVRVELVQRRSRKITATTSLAAKVVWGDVEEEPEPVVKTTAKKGRHDVFEVGQPVEMRFKAADGREIDLAKLRGKVVLVDFWAPWCPPCVAEAPRVVAAYQKYHEKGFEILGISGDKDPAAAQKFMKEHGMTWPQYFKDPGDNNRFGRKFQVHGIPAMFLIDKNGILVTRRARKDLDSKVEKLLAQ